MSWKEQSEHARVVRERYAELRQGMQRVKDPSWYAYEGYCAAGRGRAGAGHLAWERVAPRFHMVRSQCIHRGEPFDDRRAAYAMGYGLGLSDHGQVSAAGAESLLEALLPATTSRLPLYRNTRFWLFVCLIFTFEFSLVGAAEIEDPEYALVTTPLLGEFFSDESLADSSGANPELAREEVLQEKLNETISGRYPLAETLSLLTKVSDETAATAMEQLLAGLHGHERAQVVEALSRLGTPRCTALLIRTLRDADVDVVDAVLVSLVARGENTAVPQIVPLLSHSNPRLRRVAAEAIGVLAGEESASLLLPALMDQDLGVRVAVRSALTQIVGQDLGPSPVRWWQRLHAASR